MALVLAIISEEKIWKDSKSYTDRNCVSQEDVVTFSGDSMESAETDTDDEEQIPLKRSKRQIAEAEIEKYGIILATSAVIAVTMATICLIIVLHIFIYVRWGITRRLICLNTKVCALESRLGTRQLSEAMQKRLCEEIGAAYGVVQVERQRFVQEVANEERKMVEEVVKSENEPQYETMRGIGDEVFGPKKTAEQFGQSPVASMTPSPENKPEEEHHYENVRKEEKKPEPEEPAYEMFDAKNDAAKKISKDKKCETRAAIQIDAKVPETTQLPETNPTEIKVPLTGGMVEQTDPNYQTLVGMENEKIFKKKC